MEMPSEEEQAIAEKYVLERPIVRPDTDAKKAITSIVFFVVITTIISFIAFYLSGRLGIFSLFPKSVQNFNKIHPIGFMCLFILTIYLFAGLCCLKTAIIGCIKLYQHYAPEEIRRRCLFKPTCSEYAILAVKKYGVIIGLFKTYIRLFKKCRGNIYRIDYP